MEIADSYFEEHQDELEHRYWTYEYIKWMALKFYTEMKPDGINLRFPRNSKGQNIAAFANYCHMKVFVGKDYERDQRRQKRCRNALDNALKQVRVVTFVLPAWSDDHPKTQPTYTNTGADYESADDSENSQSSQLSQQSQSSQRSSRSARSGMSSASETNRHVSPSASQSDAAGGSTSTITPGRVTEDDVLHYLRNLSEMNRALFIREHLSEEVAALEKLQMTPVSIASCKTCYCLCLCLCFNKNLLLKFLGKSIGRFATIVARNQIGDHAGITATIER